MRRLLVCIIFIGLGFGIIAVLLSMTVSLAIVGICRLINCPMPDYFIYYASIGAIICGVVVCASWFVYPAVVIRKAAGRFLSTSTQQDLGQVKNIKKNPVVRKED